MYNIYVVQKGDTIDSIAKKFSIDPQMLYQINGFLPDYVLIEGTSIIVPRTVSNDFFDYYTVQKGDSLYKIANDFNTDTNLLAQLNGVNINDYIYPNQTIMVPKKDTNIYITKDGDTLNSIAISMNTNPSNIINQNKRIYLLPEQLIVFKETYN